MRREKIAKMLVVAMIAGVAYTTEAKASTIVEMNQTNVQVEKDTEETSEQLRTAVEEMRTALTELEEGSEDYDRILKFAVTALERIRPLNIDPSSDLYVHYTWVSQSYNDVLRIIEENKQEKPDVDEETVNELAAAVDEMKVALAELESGSTDYERILTFAGTALERIRELDIDSSSELYDNYTWVSQSYNEVLRIISENSKTNVQADNAGSEQLSVAVEEMRIALTELENGSKDYERILTFAGTALERIRPLNIDPSSDLYVHYSWVVQSYNDVLRTIEEIEQGQTGEDEETVNELAAAVDEMKVALAELEGGSTDYERILTFAGTALERVRGLDIDSSSELYDNYRWVIDTYDIILNAVK